MVLDTYVEASRSVFYFWVGSVGLAWLLMWAIKDKGLQRKEERVEAEQKAETGYRRGDEESGSPALSGDEEGPTRDEKTGVQGVVVSGAYGDKP